jgi:hypothetical protein
MEETFSDHLVKSRTFIQFDNVRDKLDSQFLEPFFTADTGFPARTAYQRASRPKVAAIASIVETCRRLDINPCAYLRDVLPKLGEWTANRDENCHMQRHESS